MRIPPLPAAVVACLLALVSPSPADAAFLTYNFAGTTVGPNPLAVTGTITFDTNTPTVGYNPVTFTYGPSPTSPARATFVVNGTPTAYTATSFDANDFLSVQQTPGVADVFRFDIAGFALTLSNTTGTALQNLSLATPFDQAIFSNFSLVATTGGQTYNVNITSFSSTTPEPPSILMTSMAGLGVVLARRARDKS